MIVLVNFTFGQIRQEYSYGNNCVEVNSSSTSIILKSGHFIPNVVRYDYTGEITFKAIVTGGEPSEIFLLVENTKYPLNRIGNNTGNGPTGIVYSVTLNVKSILNKMQEDDVFRIFVGYLDIYENGQRIFRYNEFIQVWNNSIPLVATKVTPNGLVYSDNVINVTKDMNYDNADGLIPDITQMVFKEFEDKYDFASIILVPGYNANRVHYGIKNDVKGIGLNQFDYGLQYGSNGMLKGLELFPLPGLYDGATQAYSHELGHQWINFLSGTPYELGTPHWPYCNHSYGIMGISIGGQGGQGGIFPYKLSIKDGIFKFVPYSPAEPGKFFLDLDLYLMGLIPASEVESKYIYKYPNSVPTENQTYSSSDFIYYTMDDLLKVVGERFPDHRNSPKTFKILTIVVSPEKLSDIEHSFFAYFTKRAEGLEPVQVHDGLLKEISNPFYKATKGLASLDTKINEISTSTNSFSLSDSNFYILPNPNSGKFKLNIRNCQSQRCNIRVINDLGLVLLVKTVYPNTNNQMVEFDLSGLPKMVYFMQIFHEWKWDTIKIILQ